MNILSRKKTKIPKSNPVNEFRQLLTPDKYWRPFLLGQHAFTVNLVSNFIFGNRRVPVQVTLSSSINAEQLTIVYGTEKISRVFWRPAPSKIHITRYSFPVAPSSRHNSGHNAPVVIIKPSR